MPAERSRAGALAAIVPLLIAGLAAGCGKSGQYGAGESRLQPRPRTAQDPAETAAAPATPSATVAAPAATVPGPTATTAAPPSKVKHLKHVAPAHPVPPAFQPAPGAPSDEEVRAELAQLSAAERAERVRELSAAAGSLAGLLPWSLENKSGTQLSVASVFTDYGLGLACGGSLGRHQLGVAHKTAPCGTLITFTYGARSITVPVIDRGPYVAGREWDLTGATAEALGFPGLGEIEWSLAG